MNQSGLGNAGEGTTTSGDDDLRRKIADSTPPPETAGGTKSKMQKPLELDDVDDEFYISGNGSNSNSIPLVISNEKSSSRRPSKEAPWMPPGTPPGYSLLASISSKDSLLSLSVSPAEADGDASKSEQPRSRDTTRKRSSKLKEQDMIAEEVADFEVSPAAVTASAPPSPGGEVNTNDAAAAPAATPSPAPPSTFEPKAKDIEAVEDEASLSKEAAPQARLSDEDHGEEQPKGETAAEVDHELGVLRERLDQIQETPPPPAARSTTDRRIKLTDTELFVIGVNDYLQQVIGGNDGPRGLSEAERPLVVVQQNVDRLDPTRSSASSTNSASRPNSASDGILSAVDGEQEQANTVVTSSKETREEPIHVADGNKSKLASTGLPGGIGGGPSRASGKPKSFITEGRKKMKAGGQSRRETSRPGHMLLRAAPRPKGKTDTAACGPCAPSQQRARGRAEESPKKPSPAKHDTDAVPPPRPLHKADLRAVCRRRPLAPFQPAARTTTADQKSAKARADEVEFVRKMVLGAHSRNRVVTRDTSINDVCKFGHRDHCLTYGGVSDTKANDWARRGIKETGGGAGTTTSKTVTVSSTLAEGEGERPGADLKSKRLDFAQRRRSGSRIGGSRSFLRHGTCSSFSHDQHPVHVDKVLPEHCRTSYVTPGKPLSTVSLSSKVEFSSLRYVEHKRFIKFMEQKQLEAEEKEEAKQKLLP